MRFHRTTGIFLIGQVALLCWLAGCQPSPEIDKGEPLAKVYNRTLYQADIEGMIPSDITREDSLLMANAIIERWVRDALLLFEAEQNIPGDLNIEELVEDYRSSLVLNNYEKILVETSLDSTVTEAELQEMYSQTSEQFVLEEPVYKIFLLKIDKDASEVADFQRMWRSRRSPVEQWYEWIDHNSAAEVFDTSQWIGRRALNAMIPWDEPQNGWELRRYNKETEDALYFLYPMEKLDAGELAPWTYVASRLKSLVLHQRKIQLIESHKEELYERESKRNNVKIYTR